MPYDSSTPYDSPAVYDLPELPVWPVSAHRQWYNRQAFGRQFIPSLFRGVGTATAIIPDIVIDLVNFSHLHTDTVDLDHLQPDTVGFSWTVTDIVDYDA